MNNASAVYEYFQPCSPADYNVLSVLTAETNTALHPELQIPPERQQELLPGPEIATNPSDGILSLNLSHCTIFFAVLQCVYSCIMYLTPVKSDRSHTVGSADPSQSSDLSAPSSGLKSHSPLSSSTQKVAFVFANVFLKTKRRIFEIKHQYLMSLNRYSVSSKTLQQRTLSIPTNQCSLSYQHWLSYHQKSLISDHHMGEEGEVPSLSLCAVWVIRWLDSVINKEQTKSFNLLNKIRSFSSMWWKNHTLL